MSIVVILKSLSVQYYIIDVNVICTFWIISPKGLLFFYSHPIGIMAVTPTSVESRTNIRFFFPTQD